MTDTPPPTEPSPGVAYWRLMVASAFAMLVFGAVVAVPSVCLESIGRAFSLNFEQRAFLSVVRMIGLLASLLATGYLADRLGWRHFLVWGLALIALAQVGAAGAPGYGALIGASAVSGLGKGAMEALVNPLVAQLNPRRSAPMLNLINGLFAVGLVVAALSTGEMLEAGASWRLPFWIWAAPALVCAGLFVTRRYPAIQATEQESGARRRFMGDPLFWLLFAGMVLGGGCEAGLTNWGPNFVEDVLGGSARSGAVTLALFGAFMAAGRFAGGAVMTRVAPVTFMIASAVACAAATWGIYWVESVWVGWVLFGLGGLFVGCFWPTILSIASDYISAGSAGLFALLASAGIVGCVLFPWAMGRIGDTLSLRASTLILPASMVAQVAVLAAVSRLVARR